MIPVLIPIRHHLTKNIFGFCQLCCATFQRLRYLPCTCLYLLPVSLSTSKPVATAVGNIVCLVSSQQQRVQVVAEAEAVAVEVEGAGGHF